MKLGKEISFAKPNDLRLFGSGFLLFDLGVLPSLLLHEPDDLLVLRELDVRPHKARRIDSRPPA
jgi:hypothetical protein